MGALLCVSMAESPRWTGALIGAVQYVTGIIKGATGTGQPLLGRLTWRLVDPAYTLV